MVELRKRLCVTGVAIDIFVWLVIILLLFVLDNARVAQLAERSIRNAEVVGSIPTEGCGVMPRIQAFAALVDFSWWLAIIDKCEPSFTGIWAEQRIFVRSNPPNIEQ